MPQPVAIPITAAIAAPAANRLISSIPLDRKVRRKTALQKARHIPA
jgi:hypothetical protein